MRQTMRHTVCCFSIFSTTQGFFSSSLVLPLYQIFTFDLKLFGSSKRYNSYLGFTLSLKALHVLVRWQVSVICPCISLHLFLTSGVYADIEWVIVKGVASYFHQSQSATSEWISFASTMAASVVAKMLTDPAVFQEWPHYNQGKSHHWKNNLNGEMGEKWLFLAWFFLTAPNKWACLQGNHLEDKHI